MIRIPVVTIAFEVHVLNEDGIVTEVRNVNARVPEAGFQATLTELVSKVSASVAGGE